MRRRDFLRTVGAGAAAMALAGKGLHAAEEPSKPNILFIFADDQTYESICALGYDEVETPNLDRLVRNGVTFTHAYNQGSWSGAVCIASRCMLNTGRFLWHAQKVYGEAEKERAAGRFWSEYMKKAGYKTYMTGKWHVKADPEKAFDVAKDPRPGMPRQTKQGYNRPIEGKGLRDEKLGPFPRTKYAVKVNRQEYYAIITHMDAQVGRILDALEKSGKADNTYIFFSADHGLSVGHHGLFGKQNLFDHSVRVPLMVTGPGIAGGKMLHTPVYLQDIMPSTLELAGVPQPDHVEFRSLMPIIRGKRQSSYDAIYGGYLSVQRMVTMDGHKLLLYPKCKKVLLFDLRKDPDEMVDLAAKPQSKPIIKKLFARLLELQAATGDKLDIKSVFGSLL